MLFAFHAQGVLSSSNGVHANGMLLGREMHVHDDLSQIITRIVIHSCFFRDVAVIVGVWQAVEKCTLVVFGFRRPLALRGAALAGYEASAYSCIGGPGCKDQVGARIDGGCVSSAFGICLLLRNVGAFAG